MVLVVMEEEAEEVRKTCGFSFPVCVCEREREK
jgi:hypothetical protein